MKSTLKSMKRVRGWALMLPSKEICKTETDIPCSKPYPNFCNHINKHPEFWYVLTEKPSKLMRKVFVEVIISPIQKKGGGRR